MLRACARFSPQRAEARLGEEMVVNDYALKTRWCKCTIKFQIPFGWFSNHFFLTISRGSKLFYTISRCYFHIESPACGARSKTTIVRKTQWSKLFFNRYLVKIGWNGLFTLALGVSEYFSESTRVLSGQYSSTLGAVLEYFHRSTGVFLGEYSSTSPRVLAEGVRKEKKEGDNGRPAWGNVVFCWIEKKNVG